MNSAMTYSVGDGPVRLGEWPNPTTSTPVGAPVDLGKAWLVMWRPKGGEQFDVMRAYREEWRANVQLACAECNSRKGGATLGQLRLA